ncbi:hypothetical protein ACN1C3_28280, partial [Pseudomonas sp. H11T01]|uniref:hypothetical protein n=1 Tax=Pseudomonas sp. H11T01 TaxID=3402749 RepID=UPI003AC0AF5E
VEIDFFDFGVGTHHEVRAPEKNREHSIGDQVAALNVGFMERLLTKSLVTKVLFFKYYGEDIKLYRAAGRRSLNQRVYNKFRTRIQNFVDGDRTEYFEHLT